MKTITDIIDICLSQYLRDVHRYIYCRTDIDSCLNATWGAKIAIDMVYEGEY